MSSTSTWTGFARPNLGWFALLDGGMAALAILAASRSAYDAAADTVPLPSQRALRFLLAGAVAVHLGEATLAYRSARRHGLSTAAPRWCAQTFVVGFPSLLKLREVAEATATTTAGHHLAQL